MSETNLIAAVKSAIYSSIKDEVLINSEKKEIKKLLTELAPDKHLCDVLRSEVFDLANTHINEKNYPFIIKWVEDLNKVLLSVQKQKSINERVYFSPGEDCLNAIIHQINSARQIIQICLFTISDNRISESIINRHNNGVHIKIITDNDKVFDKGSDIGLLFKNGIPVKVDVTENHMHHKFALFDKQSTITGSYNWTRSAERYNHENILITDSDVIAKEFNREFDQLWEECVFYDNI